jgi:nitronate monooxygenase
MAALLRERPGLTVPVVQAPMAGVSTPALAAAVSDAGGLGSVGVGTSTPAQAEQTIADVRRLTGRPFNVNFFCHRAAAAAPARDEAWLARSAGLFERFGARPPATLREVYTPFPDDREMLAVLLRHRPPVVSFHFGLPPADVVARLRSAGALLFATATSLAEAAAAAGVDAVVAQGYEAGGHRGCFDPDAPDDRLGTLALTRLLVRRQRLPVIAAGGIMDGAGVAAALVLGAAAAQLGTAFVACRESAADAAYRAALAGDAADHTVMTRAISGRPARCLANAFTRWAVGVADADVPAYPLAYDLSKSLDAAARARGEFGFGAQWAGQGAPLSRPMPAADLVATLAGEIVAAQRCGP